ncbi:MAG: single-stranded DNA-binding protein [Mariprofundaceae bacterium]
MNQVFIEGNAANIKMNEKGNFVSLSIAENIRYKKDDKTIEETHWYAVVAYNGTAKFIHEHVNKGDRVLIHGRLTTSTYEKDGSNVTVLQIVANEVRITARKK